jgi:hypothetical protein
MADLRVGAGRARIALPEAFLPIGGFGAGHDPLRVRVLLIDDGTASLTVAAVDRCLPPDAHAGIRRVLAHVTHQDPVRVLVCAGHDHPCGPMLVLSETVQNAIENAVAWAAFTARTSCRSARVSRAVAAGGAGADRLGPCGADELELSGAGHPELSGAGHPELSGAEHPELSGADRLEGDDGQPIAMLLPGGSGLLTADEIEHAEHDEFVALFLTKAAAECMAEVLDRAR